MNIWSKGKVNKIGYFFWQLELHVENIINNKAFSQRLCCRLQAPGNIWDAKIKIKKSNRVYLIVCAVR